METESNIRLNKHLALQLGVSRREADDLISSGQVSINGEPAILGSRFNVNDSVSVKGKPLGEAVQFQYLAFHKPVGYICSRRAQGDTQTIYSLIPKDYHSLKPVGRLDKDSSGLLLLTNDGNFAYQMTHPKFYKTKLYQVRLDRNLEPLHQQMIADHGIRLADGPSKLALAKLKEERRDEWEVAMTEGRNRQIRRTFAALGYNVTALHRIKFGNYSIGDIPSGSYKILNIS